MGKLRRLSNPYYVIPFETAFGLFAVINGMLTLNIDSSVLQNLYSLVGFGAFIFPISQIVAGMLILSGIGTQKGNIECGGIILAISMFAVRVVSLLTDGDITLTDLNSTAIFVLLLFAGLIRINHIWIVSRELDRLAE